MVKMVVAIVLESVEDDMSISNFMLEIIYLRWQLAELKFVDYYLTLE